MEKLGNETSNFTVNNVKSTNVSSDTNNVNNENNVKSYAAATGRESFATNFVFPGRDQGLLLPALSGISKNEFIVGIGKLVGPKNVIFASRISNGRICIYLSSKDILDKFMQEHKGIKLGDEFLAARRLITPSKKVILSNVSPSIPNSVIYDELKRLNLKAVSAISFIGAGVSDPNYKHVYSFRRQVFIALEDDQSVPSCIVVKHNGEINRIFFSTDNMRCFICNNLGHISTKCPSHLMGNNASGDKPSILDTSVGVQGESFNEQMAENTADKSLPTEANNGATISTPDPNIAQTSEDSSTRPLQLSDSGKTSKFKRPAESSNDSIDIALDCETNENKQPKEQSFKKPHPKKIKTKSTDDDIFLFREFESVFNEKQIISYDTFCEFLVKVKGQQNVYDVATLFNENVSEMLQLTIKARRLATTGRLKSRLKRLCMSLNKAVNKPFEMDASDCSQDDYSECSQSAMSETDK